MNFIKLSCAIALGVIIGATSTNFAMSALPINYKIAVVDVQRIVNSSSQVQTFKQEQKKKLEELTKFVSSAKNELAKVSNESERKALEEKYNKEFAVKKEEIEKNYATKLSKIDADISKVVADKAKSGQYNIVLAKSLVLWGGDDITTEVSKSIK